MIELALTLVIAAAAHGYGLSILLRLGTLPRGGAERALLAALLGAGVLTFAVLAAGLVGALTIVFGGVLVMVGLGITAYALRGVKLNELIPAGIKSVHDLRQAGPLAWGCWLFLLVSAMLNLIAALAPISGTDVLAYHLAIPKLYAEEGRIRYVPGVYYATAPFGLEMLYTLAILLGAPIAAQVLHFAFGIAATLAVYLLGVRTFSARAGLLGATIFYAITDVGVQSSIALIDLGAAAYLLGAVLAALRWREQGGRWIFLAALLAGLHAGTKMPNLSGAAALWIALALDVLIRRELRIAWRPWAVGGMVVALVALPWFARSWAWTGNPVYPYLNSTFHGRDFSAEASARQLETQYYKTIGDRTLDRLLLAPFTLTVTPDAFRSGYMGPLYLAFLPFVALVPLSRAARLTLLFALISLPIWYLLYPRLRTLLPVLGVLSAPVAASIINLGRLHPLTRLVGIGVVAVWLITSLASNARYHVPAIPVVLGSESDESFLRRRLPLADSGFFWYEDFQELNHVLPREAVVLLWDTRGYYLERRYIWANAVAQGLIDPERQRDPAELVRALGELGVTHVAMYPGEAPADSGVPIQQLQRTLQMSGALRVVYSSRAMVLSELVP